MTINAYQVVRKSSLIEGATPHELTSILYDAALNNIAVARECIPQKSRVEFQKRISKTVAIVQELQSSLRDYKTNELAGNLFELYSYIVSTLITSSKNMDDEGLGVCAHLLDVLRDAWKAIAPENTVAA